jgi:Tol biopolymer transport system component
MLKRGLPPAGPKRLVAGWKASWSPDATQLVFGKVGGPGLRILNLEDGQVTDLVDFGKDPAWSPDGRFIAFVKEPTPDAYLAEEVWLVKPTGQSPRKLADGGFLIWSRDSKRLYVHSRTENYIFSIEVDDPNGKPQVDEAIGSVAPEIEGEDIDGEPFKLSDYRGKVVVLDFWGDW